MTENCETHDRERDGIRAAVAARSTVTLSRQSSLLLKLAIAISMPLKVSQKGSNLCRLWKRK